ncbi:unnamed protein product [Macrosiphum euphorbiae]|nr:unnamed protein product [Macrosiphum euphorbiae]
MRLTVNDFIFNRKVTSSDVQDLLCGRTDVPIYINDRIQVASQRATQAFYETVEGILSCKEQDARLDETEARATPNQQNEIPGR